MKYWTPSLIALIVVLYFRSRPIVAETTESSLVTHATTIFDLQYVFGPNYRLFVVLYWRFMSLSCNYLSSRIGEDIGTGRLEKYCLYLTRCPVVYPTQSCLVQISVYAIRLACCTESLDTPSIATPTTTRQPPVTPDLTKTASSTFNLVDQQTCNYGRVFPSGKIFGGTEARQGEFPWMIMMLKNSKFLCGGVLLDSTHVLTAAHCFDIHVNSNYYEVIAGKYSLGKTDPTEQRVAVKSFVIHQNYNLSTTWNDLALLVLVEPLVINNWVIPACLPSATDKLETFCTVAGWGKTEEREPPSVLMKVELQTYNWTQCYEEFKDTADALQTYIHDGAICAANGKLGGKDACQGDSGSPLMCIKRTGTSAAWFVVAIVSNGNKCALVGDPGIYVNLQHYLGWINTTIHSMT